MTYFLVLQFTFFTSANGLIRLCHDRSLGRRAAVVMERDITSNHTYTRQQSTHPGQSVEDKLSCSYGTTFCSSFDNMHYTALSHAAGCKQGPSQSAAVQQATDVGLSLSLISNSLKITQHRWFRSTVEVHMAHHVSKERQCSWWEMWVMWAAAAFLIIALPACLADSSCCCCISDITYPGPCFFYKVIGHILRVP